MSRRRLAWVVLAGVLAAGCGVRPSGVIRGGPAPTGQTRGIALYFLTDSALTPVFRPARPGLRPAQTLALLGQGPTGAERAAGLTSEVPAGLDPVRVSTGAAGGVEVAVSADVGTLTPAAVDQIVCTVRDALATTAPITLTSATGRTRARTCPSPAEPPR